MGDTTKIEWADHTASPWYGCSHAVLSDGAEHPGCANCYAEAMAKRNPSTLGEWGPDGTRVLSKSFSANCIKWNAEAQREGVRQSVFPSLCDPFEFNEAWEGPLDSWRAGLFAVIDKCPWLDFLLLTKRPQNVPKMWCSHVNTDGKPPSKLFRKNVWLLASASDQKTYDAMAPHLWQCRKLVPVLGWSMEPLVGPISPWNAYDGQYVRMWSGCWDWIIVGGESGPNARPMHPDWVRSIRDKCVDAGTPLFFKQWGEWLPEAGRVEGQQVNAGTMASHRYGDRFGSWNGDKFEIGHARHPVTALRVGKVAAGRMLDGRTWDEFPAAKAAAGV